MPDPASPKAHLHPYKRAGLPITGTAVHSNGNAKYAELSALSNFSFLRGASHPDELVQQAAALGCHAIAITDVNSLAGIVRAHVAAKEVGISFIVGSRLRFQDANWLDLTVYPTTRAAYGNLCRLLTLGKRRAPKGECDLSLADLNEYAEGLLAIVHVTKTPDDAAATLARLHERFQDDRLSLAISRSYHASDAQRLRAIPRLARTTNLPLVVTNDVHYHVATRRPLQDILTCIRHGCTVAEAGFRLWPNAERHLKSPDEMSRLFTDFPRALARSIDITERASHFSLDLLRYEYPDKVCPAGLTPMEYLEQCTWSGAARRYPDGVPEKVRSQLHHEFALIRELNYAAYFLTVYDIVTFARARGILCQGRGAAANSAVCFCLGLTSVDPARIDVLFERFVSRERNEPPDIDIDFEHERREEVIQYIYEKYSRERAGLTAEVISYRGRSAVRDVGKALGLSLDAVDAIAKQLSHWDDNPFDRDDSAVSRLGLHANQGTLRHLVRLVRELIGFPRHLGQHVGGFVITRGFLCDLVPIENAAMPDRTVIEWDKDDIDALGMLKVDILGLGMLTCIRKALELIDRHHARPLTLATIPAEDPLVYDMICDADTLGVFQVESRAQMSMLPRLKPRTFYDLVIEVAIVRPGPIVGDMVHPYLRRRDKQEEPHYPDEKVRCILEKTLGIPLFQEQAMSLAIVAAGFSPGEADHLRRTISAWKSRGRDAIPRYRRRFLDGMRQNGYSLTFAEQCFERLKGFSEYGFPESHAASFALLVYASAWIKRHYPVVFACALLNSQPLGFYAPAQIVRDAIDHGVAVRPVDVNQSAWDCTIEEGGAALRLGMRMVQGLRRVDADALVAAVAEHGSISSLANFCRLSGVRPSGLRPLALADAFGSIGVPRQQALWQLQELHDEALPLLENPLQGESTPLPSALLPPTSGTLDVLRDYRSVGLSLKHHPMEFLRPGLARRNVKPIAEIKDEIRSPHGRGLAVAGVVLVRQRPSTAKGVLFMTIEDETGRLDLIVRQFVQKRCRSAAIFAQFILVYGRVERQGRVVHVLPHKIETLVETPDDRTYASRDFR